CSCQPERPLLQYWATAKERGQGQERKPGRGIDIFGCALARFIPDRCPFNGGVSHGDGCVAPGGPGGSSDRSACDVHRRRDVFASRNLPSCYDDMELVLSFREWLVGVPGPAFRNR